MSLVPPGEAASQFPVLTEENFICFPSRLDHVSSGANPASNKDWCPLHAGWPSLTSLPWRSSGIAWFHPVLLTPMNPWSCQEIKEGKARVSRQGCQASACSAADGGDGASSSALPQHLQTSGVLGFGVTSQSWYSALAPVLAAIRSTKTVHSEPRSPWLVLSRVKLP